MWTCRQSCIPEGLAGEEIRILVVFAHRDVEVAHDAFVLLKLEVGPLSFVDKLFQGLLQIIEYRLVRARNLGMVDGNLRLQFLCLRRYSTKADEPARQ